MKLLTTKSTDLYIDTLAFHPRELVHHVEFIGHSGKSKKSSPACRQMGQKSKTRDLCQRFSKMEPADVAELYGKRSQPCESAYLPGCLLRKILREARRRLPGLPVKKQPGLKKQMPIRNYFENIKVFPQFFVLQAVKINCCGSYPFPEMS